MHRAPDDIANIFGESPMLLFSLSFVLTYIMDAQKNRLIETVLFSTHNVCFG